MAEKNTLELDTGDWRKDPRLSMCSPATRGVWIDALAVMIDSDRSGVLTGTPDQLARVLRCTPSDIQIAIAELTSTGAADIRESNGLVTLINRRMKREYEQRRRNAKRQKNQRLGLSVPAESSQELLPYNENVTPDVTGMSHDPGGGSACDNVVTFIVTEDVRGNFSPHTPLYKNNLNNINNISGGGKGDARGKGVKIKTPPPAFEDFVITPRLREVAAESGVVDLAGEIEKGLDHFRANGERKADWEATMKNWMRNSVKFNQTKGVRSSKTAEKPVETGKYDHLYE